MCSPVYVLACHPFGIVCRNSGLPGMHILILLLVSGTCRIPGILVAWIGEICWWCCCPSVNIQDSVVADPTVSALSPKPHCDHRLGRQHKETFLVQVGGGKLAETEHKEALVSLNCAGPAERAARSDVTHAAGSPDAGSGFVRLYPIQWKVVV